MSTTHFFLLSGLWIGYFLIHSILASHRFKAWFNKRYHHLAHTYRLIYNLSSAALLLPMMYFIYFVPSEQIITWPPPVSYVANLIALIAMMGFIYSFKFYGGMDFSGINQFKNKTNHETGDFVISPLHRYVRHPWYLFALMIIWTRDMNAHFLISACWMTAYFFIGSYFEEQKLQRQFGERYSQYMTKVPGIIPSFKRYLTPDDAASLSQQD